MMEKPMRLSLTLLAGSTFILAAATGAADPIPSAVTITLKDHIFSPATITVPAGQRISVELINQDGTQEEFDSDDLHAEKVVAPHRKVIFQIAALKPGTYRFEGELHAKTAQGVMIAAPAP
jgi:plastocyanin